MEFTPGKSFRGAPPPRTPAELCTTPRSLALGSRVDLTHPYACRNCASQECHVDSHAMLCIECNGPVCVVCQRVHVPETLSICSQC